jgi:hypothetical protein
MKTTAQRRREAEDWIKPGRIMLLDCEFAGKPKFLIVASDDPLLCFVINSEISAYINERPSLSQCQVSIRQGDHPQYLTHDSYADCSKVINTITKLRAVSQLVADGRRMKGHVTGAEREAIIAAFQLSRVLSPAQKKHLLAKWQVH